MKTLRILFVIFLIAVIGFGIIKKVTAPELQDCVPATLIRVFPQYTKKQMLKICNTKSTGTTLNDMLTAWSLLTTNDCHAVYSRVFDVRGDDNHEINFTNVYIWIGYDGIGYHCALSKFAEDKVYISNSQYKHDSTNWYVTTITYKNFLKNTILLLHPKELQKDIRFE